MRGWWIGLAIAMAACPPPHGPAIPALPGSGGPAWVEVTSPHFSVWTDSSEPRARVLAQQMEDYRRIIVGVLFNGAEVKAPPTLVLALRDAEEVGAYVPKEFIAYAYGGGALRQPAIIVAANTSDDDNHIFVHELTHAITFGVVPHQPKWFAEGLAGFFETVKPRAGTDVVEIGRPRDYIAERLRVLHPTPAAAMFACDQHACMDDMFYASTWAAFSFLISTRPQALVQYIERLGDLDAMSTDTGPERAAWGEVFPDLPPDQLDHELAKWLAAGKRLVISYKFKSEPVAVTARPLTGADVLAARGIMRWIFAPESAATRAELDAALAADPTQLLARLVVTSVAKSVTVEDAHRVSAAHPDDWRAWWLVAYAAQRGPDAKEAHDKLCALVGDNLPVGMPRSYCAH